MASQDRFGEMLVREKVISPAQLRQAQETARKSGGRLGDELVKRGVIAEGEVTSYLSRMHGVPSIDLENYEIAPKLLELVPRQVAERHMCVPVNRAGSTLVVAMADPSNIFAIDDLKFMTNYNVEVVVAPRPRSRRRSPRRTARARTRTSRSTTTTSSRTLIWTTSTTRSATRRTPMI